METLKNKVSISIDCKAEKIYNLITIPQNWVGLHPVTKAVYGPTIQNSGKNNDVWIEHIDTRDTLYPLNAAWIVTQTDPYKIWEIKSVFFGGLGVTIIITYFFEESANKTTFTRVMQTQAKKGYLSSEQKQTFTSVDNHQEYLERIKKRIESLH